jgi:gliding motility-associated-like protein
MTKRSLIILLLQAAASTLFAQPYVSRLGRFQVDQIKACEGFPITLTNLLAANCDGTRPCRMDYEGNGTSVQNQFTFTYTKAGTFKLSVLYQSIGLDDITITIVPNIQPNFEIYSCNSNGVRIKVTDNNFEQYAIDFGDGTPETFLPFTNNILTPSHTYIVPPTTYTTKVRGRNTGSADNCTAKMQPFNPIVSLPTPTVTGLTAIDPTTVKLDYTTSINILYKLEISVNGSTPFQVLQNVYGSGANSITIPNLKLDDNYYCFRLSAFDVCTNTNSASSATICTHKFTATASSFVNKLVWTTGAGGTYSILRDNGPLFNTSSTTFNDLPPSIVCKTKYCYKVITNYGGTVRSISLEKCATAFSTIIPTAITDISSTVHGDVELTWIQDPNFVPQNYSISKSVNGGAFGFLSTSAAAKFTDALYTSTDRNCYRVSYIDKCDNPSPQGSTACPVRLDGKLDKKNVITLTWSSYKGWAGGVKNYVLEKYNLQGALIGSITLTDTTYTDDQVDNANQLVRYDVKAVPNSALVPIVSLSNVVEFIKNANIYFPTAFTPNKDNLNDYFIVTGQFISKINMKIFDRWGSLLYATEKNEPWDGYREGKPMPPSTYVWKVEITDLAGRTFSQEGIVALILN